MKRNLVLAAALVVSLCSLGYAEEGETGSEAKTDWKKEKQGFVQQQKEENKEWRDDFQSRRKAALEEYKAQGLSPEEIKEKMAGYREEAKEHRQSQKTENREFAQNLKTERKAARLEKMDANKDGDIDKAERKKFGNRKDRDNNPPGPKGGPGTNWENRPGPKGGPGTSLDRGLHKGYNRGVRDYGKGIGKGKGQGPLHRKK